MIKWLMICSGLCLSSFPALAQVEAVELIEERAEQGPSLRVTCLGEWNGKELYLKLPKPKKGKKMIKVDIMNLGYSASIKFDRSKPVQFFEKTLDDEQPYKSVLKVKIPAKVKQPLILLVPTSKKVLHRVFDIHPSTFPFGSCQVVNFSRKELRIALDKDQRRLKKMKSAMFQPYKGEKKSAWFRIADAESKKMVFTTMMMRRSSKRVLIFLVEGAYQQGRVEMKTKMLVDFEPT